MPTLKQRRAACTHLSVTRLFDPLDSITCQMCGRRSPFGWLYRCTQDYNSFLPRSDFSVTEPEDCNSRLSEQAVTSQLSQSILRGIEDGHYSAQQIRLLEAQKLRVRRSITMQEEKLENLSDSSQTSSSLWSSDSAVEDSILITADIHEALHRQSTNNCSGTTMKSSCHDERPHALMPSAAKTYIQPLFPKCHFKCCQSCRPAYRDRAFQSLDAILSEPIKQPPQWEFENRRVSDANMLKRIQMPLSRLHLHSTYQPFDDLRDSNASQTFASSENEDAVLETSEKKDETWRRSGFRERVRKALGAIDQSTYLATSTKSSKHSSKSSSRESLMQMPRSMLLKIHRKQAEKENQIVSNRALQESLALMLAANTPLPRASEDSESLEGGEVKVEDGVAVTEEGVAMSAADIIIQT